MERIKRREKNESMQQHYPMKSVLQDMDPNEREALHNGSRKRKAPVESSNKQGNLQRKKVNAQGPPVINKEEDDDFMDAQALRLMKQQRQRNQRKVIVDEESEESMSDDDDDDDDFDSDEAFGADDDSI